jgi:uncharacterized protein (DUF362 family)
VKTPVALIRTPGYDPARFEPALDDLLACMGGLDRLVRRDDRVMLKPNCIAPRPREQGTQTDPALLIGVARRLIDLGARPFVGESPAWGTLEGNLRKVGALDGLRKLGVPIVEFRHGRRIDNYRGRHYDHFLIASPAASADRIINLPKLKAHKQLGLTAAVKNMFGCIAGRRKGWWHYRAGDRKNLFGWMLVELFDRLRPCLTILDGVLGMEGDGPVDGDPRQLNWLIGSTDGIAVERVAAELVGFGAEELRTLHAAAVLKIGCCDLDQIEVLGESIESQRISDFRRAEPMPIRFPLFRVVRSGVKNLLLRRKFSTSTS